MDASPGSGLPPRTGHLLRWSRRCLVFAGVVAAVLLTARLLAPGYMKRAINRRLAEVPGHTGHVDGIGLHVWRGAYRIDHISIVKTNGKVSEPFFAADQIEFSVAWREIIRGRLVSDITITNARLNFVRGPSDETSQLTADKRWQDVINDIFPIVINHLDIKGGILRFVDTTRDPRVDIAVRNLSLEATGLRNRRSDTGEDFPARISLSGRTIGNGDLRLFAKLDPLADQPNFELAVELTKVTLPALNDVLRAYLHVDVSKGRFEVFGQMGMRNGHYEGYVKPFVDHLDFKYAGDDKKGLGERIWKDVVADIAAFIRNGKSKQIATRIPFSGESGTLDVGTWKTIANSLHHGFIHALSQGFEGTTHPDARETKIPDSAENSATAAPAKEASLAKSPL
jgi:Domain of Unknown Function (DUF748)